MNRIIPTIAAVVITLAAGVASLPAQAGAQSYYYPTTTSYSSSYGSSCVTLSRNLTYGMRGSDVSSLQSYLVAQNYPGSGSWMVTGYFGAATQTAIRNYQSQHGLAVTGWADASTRATISGCGSSSYSSGYNYGYTTPPTYQNPYQYPTYPTYPTTPTYNNLSITSLSSTSAAPGTSVTVYGTGFQYGNMVVHVGGTAVSATTGPSGSNAISFIVPSITAGGYQLYVTSGSMTSNALTFNVASTNTCNNYNYGYPYNQNCGCQSTNYYNGYNNYNNGCQNGAVSLSYLSPNSGMTGSTVTITGTGFTSTGNTVYFGQGIISNLSSYNGTSLTFTVPSTLSGYSYQQVTPGTYNVYVANSQGVTSNTLSYQVTGNTSIAPSITSVSGPTNTSTNTTNTWTVQINNPGSGYVTTSVTWGDTGSGYVNQAAPQTTYAQGYSSLTFQHAYISAGTYTITFTVTNQSGQSNTSNATVYVTGSGTSGAASLSAFPSSGYAPLTVTFTAQLNDCNGGNFDLYYGDGASDFVPVPADSCNASVTRTHTYTTSGSFTATLRDRSTSATRGTAIVSVTGSNTAAPTISYVAPTSARTGTNVVLYGTGFTSDNTVHFGQGGSMHVSSYNNNTIYYTIPQYASSCDVMPGTQCFYSQPVTPGSYPIYITNTNGTTNTVYFTVTQ